MIEVGKYSLYISSGNDWSHNYSILDKGGDRQLVKEQLAFKE